MPAAACWELLQAGTCSYVNLEVPEPRPSLWDRLLCLTKAPDCAIQGRWTLGGCFALKLFLKSSLGENLWDPCFSWQQRLEIISFLVLFSWCCLAYSKSINKTQVFPARPLGLVGCCDRSSTRCRAEEVLDGSMGL